MPKKKPAIDEIAPDPMTCVELKVDAYQRLTAAHVHPSPTGLVKVRGRNRQGKSSLLDSILEALGASRSELPIHDGEHGGEIDLDLGRIKVKKTFTRDASGKAKPKVVVTGADGSPIASPAGVLKELRSKFADPVAFIESTPLEQARTVLSILGLDEALKVLEEERDDLFEQRKDLGRDADRLGKAAFEAEEALFGLPDPPEDGELEALVFELESGKDQNADRDMTFASMNEAEARGTELAARGGRMKLELEKIEADIDAQREAYKVFRTKFRSLGPEIPVDEIAHKLANMQAGMETAGKRELAGTIRSQALAAKTAHASADEELKAKRDEIGKLLEGADFPLEGMEYDHDEKVIKINGIPFSNASQSEQIAAAASVAMAGDPKIRIMIAREGSLLDSESQAQLATLAEARGFQFWLEVVDSTREGAGIYIEDGEAFEGEQS